MLVLRSLWGGLGYDLPPATVYWTLRCLMFILSFVLEDWAVQELVRSTRQRRVAILLVASSYVTWTYQTHTFSNAIETLIVLWSLVLIGRIVDDRDRTGVYKCGALAFLCVLGAFNRITFPAFIFLPALQLLSHFRRKPFALLSMALFGALAAFIAVYVDTDFYTPDAKTIKELLQNPVITPINSFLYNSSRNNLAHHGIHPLYQHIVANLPQLLGPAYPLVFTTSLRKSTPFIAAISGVLVLSLFPHQEARFLIPVVPLILSSIRLPKQYHRPWIAAWIIFNIIFGALMGVYHQGGIVPMQNHIEGMTSVSHVFWWKTYPPPIWLLDGKNEYMRTKDLMGMPEGKMVEQVLDSLPTCYSLTSLGIHTNGSTYLVAPASATYLDSLIGSNQREDITLEEVWRYQKHLNLDDLDFADDGVMPTLDRVIGRRGLVLWKAKRQC